MQKKLLPRTLTEILDKALGNEKHLFNFYPIGQFQSLNDLLRITEKDDLDSPFFFSISYRVSRAENRFGEIYYVNEQDEEADRDDELKNRKYTCEYLPSSLENTSKGFVNASLDDIPKLLRFWTDLLKEYNKESVIFDDQILQHYYEEIAPKFKLLEPDADYAPFDYDRQELIRTIYDKARLTIEENTTEQNAKESEEIIREIEDAKGLTTKQTKNEVLEKMQKIGARFMKYGFEIGKAFVTEVSVELAKRLLIGG